MVLGGRQEASTPHLARTEVRLYFHVVAICWPVTGLRVFGESWDTFVRTMFRSSRRKELRQWMAKLGMEQRYIEPRSP